MENIEKKYHITTFGCQMNVHESEKLAFVLSNLGFRPTDDVNDADVIVFNTCAIREGAEDRAIGNIGNLKFLKKQKRDVIIAVCGCMTQQKFETEWLTKTFPFIDIIFGTSNLDKFEGFLRRRIDQKCRQIEISEDYKITENLNALRTSGENAWVNIIYGCNNFCSYCIVPYVRGRERSRAKQDILEEVKQLVKQKYKTITLLGQNVNSYGTDSNENGSFSQLLKDICAIEGDFKLTFLSSHPKDLTDETIHEISIQPKILKEIHLPVQSGSDSILKAMNRKYTVENYLLLVEKLRKEIPNIRISSDFIVGFPGETEKDFEDSKNLMKLVRFNHIFAFIFSVRKGTKAEIMDAQIDEKTKNIRVNELLALEKEIQKELK
ncbi:MAG: tRNA (N6-isopentenyl adenosine(37)-C2)-methylthiotransferase MiaB [Clostridia bacterium]